MATPLDLSSLELFRDSPPEAVAALLRRLRAQSFDAGAVVIRQGEVAGWFLIVLDGRLDVARSDGASEKHLATVGPGSIVGELSLLAGHPRLATITARTPVTAAIGDRDAFAALVQTPGVRERLTEIAARRLAATARPVPTTLRDGTPVVLRPLLAADRDAVVEALERQSPETIRHRFFTGGMPSDAVVDRLVHINYVDHFAWAVGTAPEQRGVASGRYVRDQDARDSAELAFLVDEAFRNRGVAGLLLGALAAAATRAGISTFVGHVLEDNSSMRAVFDKADAEWVRGDPGVVTATIDVARAATLVDGDLFAQLADVAAEVVTASGLALANPD